VLRTLSDPSAEPAWTPPARDPTPDPRFPIPA
jgi:hypothetical protein